MKNFTMAVEKTRKWPTDALLAWALAGIGVFTVFYAATSLTLPLGWDHNIIASVGSSYVNGGLPFVDSWDMKGPAAYLPFALTEVLFGSTMWGVRLLDLLIWAVAGIALHRGVSKLTTWRIGVGVALATYLWIASAGWFFTAAPESWVTASCILAIVPLLSPNMNLKPTLLAFSGFLIGFAGLVKPFYFAFGLAPLTAVVLCSELSLPHRAKLALALAGGAAVPLALIGGYFAIRGGLSQAVEVHLLYPLSTYVEVTTGWSTTIHGVVGLLKEPAIFIVAPFVLVAIWLYRSQMRILAIPLVWLSVALICVAVQGKYWVYHWFPVYPPLFILGALGAFALAGPERRPAAVSLIVVLCSTLMFAAVVKHPLSDVAKFAYYCGLKSDLQGYYASFNFRLYNAADEIAAARYIAAHTTSQQGVFIWGSDALYYLANRPNPSRFTFVMPLTLPGPYRAAYREEAISELMARPPTYFVTGISWDGLSKAETAMADFTAMASFLNQHYSLEKSIGVLNIYRRN